jgi:hypothetical protein
MVTVGAIETQYLTGSEFNTFFVLETLSTESNTTQRTISHVQTPPEKINIL